jgi:hypothetical protein
MMRRILWLAAAAAICVSPPSSWCQNQDQQQGRGTSASPATGTSSGAAPHESLGEAARRLREQKKAAPKAAKIFTNDNLKGAPEVAAAPAGAAPAAPGKANGAAAGATAAAPDEAAWRAKFASLRHKLEQDQADLAVMQRELSTLSLQSYDDPNKALAQQFSREDINKKTADIEARKNQIDADKQAIDDAETELRKASGNSGWAR